MPAHPAFLGSEGVPQQAPDTQQVSCRLLASGAVGRPSRLLLEQFLIFYATHG